MSRLFLIIVVLCSLASGCGDEVAKQTGIEPPAPAPPFASVSQSEDVALEQLLATLPPESHARVREIFTRTPGRYTVLSFPNDPERQALVDRVYSERRLADSRELTRRRIAANPARVPVAVALVDRLPDSLSRAVVLRRRDVEPSEVILLRRSLVTADHLAAAVASLRLVWRSAGQYPTADAIIGVRDAAPRAWTDTETPRAERLVARLQTAQPRGLPGVGNVPVITVWLKPER